MTEWTVAFGLSLKRTTGTFGARDGKPRDPNAPRLDLQPESRGAEVVDLPSAAPAIPLSQPVSAVESSAATPAEVVMRDLEFLPDWYPQLRHRKRLVRLQAYMTVLLVCGLAGFIYLVHRNIRTAAATSNELDRELIQSHREIGQLDEQVALKNQLLLQRKIDDRLGLPVEMCRMLATLDEKRPREMSLTDCQFDTQEQVRVVNSIGAARNAQKGDGIDRRMHVRLQGVAPTDNDIANFLGQLTNVSFFDQVAMSFSRDRTQDGHVMREFEITFTIDLNQQVSGGTTVATTGGGM